MSVEFEENNAIRRVAYAPQNRSSKLAQKILDTGIVKTDAQANYVLIGAAVVALIAMLIVFSKSGSARVPQPSRDAMDRALQATVMQGAGQENQ